MFFGNEDTQDTDSAMQCVGEHCVRMQCFSKVNRTPDKLLMWTSKQPSLLHISFLFLLLHAAIGYSAAQTVTSSNFPPSRTSSDGSARRTSASNTPRSLSLSASATPFLTSGLPILFTPQPSISMRTTPTKTFTPTTKILPKTTASSTSNAAVLTKTTKTTTRTRTILTTTSTTSTPTTTVLTTTSTTSTPTRTILTTTSTTSTPTRTILTTTSTTSTPTTTILTTTNAPPTPNTNTASTLTIFKPIKAISATTNPSITTFTTQSTTTTAMPHTTTTTSPPPIIPAVTSTTKSTATVSDITYNSSFDTLNTSTVVKPTIKAGIPNPTTALSSTPFTTPKHQTTASSNMTGGPVTPIVSSPSTASSNMTSGPVTPTVPTPSTASSNMTGGPETPIVSSPSIASSNMTGGPETPIVSSPSIASSNMTSGPVTPIVSSPSTASSNMTGGPVTPTVPTPSTASSNMTGGPVTPTVPTPSIASSNMTGGPVTPIVSSPSTAFSHMTRGPETPIVSSPSTASSNMTGGPVTPTVPSPSTASSNMTGGPVTPTVPTPSTASHIQLSAAAASNYENTTSSESSTSLPKTVSSNITTVTSENTTSQESSTSLPTTISFVTADYSSEQNVSSSPPPHTRVTSENTTSLESSTSSPTNVTSNNTIENVSAQNTISPESFTSLPTTVSSNVTRGNYENTTSPESSTSLPTTVSSNITTEHSSPHNTSSITPPLTKMTSGNSTNPEPSMSLPTSNLTTVTSENFTSLESSTSLPTTVTSNVTAGVYYHMLLAVNVNGDLKNQSDIRDWLYGLFQTDLDTCNPYKPLQSNNTLLSPKSSNTSRLFENLDLSCSNKTSFRSSNCSVVLHLRIPTMACCFQRALLLGGQNSSIQAQIVGTVDIVVDQGMCNNQLPPSNDNCNGSTSTTFSPQNMCNSTGPFNISCGQGWMLSIPQNQINCIKTTQAPTEVLNVCNCSAYCSGKDAYYTFGIDVTDPTINISFIYNLLNLLKSPACKNNVVTGSPCPLSSISNNYQEAYVNCNNPVTDLNSCRVIVRLNISVNVCDVSNALMTLFNTTEQSIVLNGNVTRAGICGSPGPNGDLLNSSFSWVTISMDPVMFCEAEQGSNYSVPGCNQGTNMVVLLTEECIPMATTSPRPSTTLLPPSANSTLQNNTNSSNTTSQPSQGNTTANTSAIILPVTTTSVSSNLNSTAGIIIPTTAGSLENMANGLLEMTKDVSKLNSSQVDQLVSQLQDLLAGPNVSPALGNTTLTIVSNLLGASPATLASSAKKIIGIVDTVGLKLIVQPEATILTQSVALAVKTVDGSNFQQTSFSIPDPSSVQILEVGRTRRAVITASSSPPQGSVIFPSSLTSNLPPAQQLMASRVQFNFYQKSTVFQDPSLGTSQLYSGILGASVANLSIKSLKEDVIITLKNTYPIPANHVVSCAFWDFGLNGGSGGWNREGCSVQNSTTDQTVCACNHLTSFGVLLDISRTGIQSRLQDTILTYITYIGCGVSAIFLSVTLLTYLAFGKLRKDIPSKILIQLCVALLFLNLVFLLDSWLALYPNAVGLCISTAWFLHYFLLASFTWMGLEAVHMYLALVKVFNTYISRYMLKFSLVGWGVPLVVVIIVIAVDKNNYGLVGYAQYTNNTSTDDFCWLKNNTAFYVSVVAYFCVIFLFNLIMFVVVMVQLCRIKRQNPHNLKHRNGVQDLRSVIGLTLLLGLSWGFAFFAWGPVNTAFMYLFAIFNSFQGFFIFVFHCAVKENVRRQWRTYLCCGSLRLAENSDWSRTATQKTEKKSVSANTRAMSFRSDNSSRSNNSSNSSFLPSDNTEQPAGGIGTPFDDQTISAFEEPGADVVLNEINDQLRMQNHRH
ncbi:hypothetical protein UPYG_G00116830 [Umbra pygmaea]|uniref:Adhesion G-protein coupled receptor G2 n=1 Tax=Umbra pygmaea TaxID=75934 RepID=A0ABD0X4X6_UMBPY